MKCASQAARFHMREIAKIVKLMGAENIIVARGCAERK